MTWSPPSANLSPNVNAEQADAEQNQAQYPGARFFNGTAPPAVERQYLTDQRRRLPYALAYSQDTDRVLKQANFSAKEIANLRDSGIIA